MNEEMRKEFEAWLNVYAGNEIDLSKHRGKAPNGEDGYVFESFVATSLVTSSWQAWQASREAMKPIELPVKMKNTEAAECYYYNDAIDECKEAIEQAGYKVEP